MITDWIHGARPGAWGGAQWFATVFSTFFGAPCVGRSSCDKGLMGSMVNGNVVVGNLCLGHVVAI